MNDKLIQMILVVLASLPHPNPEVRSLLEQLLYPYNGDSWKEHLINQVIFEAQRGRY